MKILHTSDWHIGHEFFNYKRDDEFEFFFRQLISIVAVERPDVMLVSGDVYHSSVPSTSTQKLYTEAMLRVHAACPEMEIIVTAGNHDSASRLEIDRSLWRHFHVHVLGSLNRTATGVNLDSHIIPIGDMGLVAAVPHVFRQNFPAASDGEDRQKRFFEALAERVQQVNKRGLPTVLMAHIAVDTGDGSRVEAGGMEFFPYTILGEGYDYIALGHLHRPHQVPPGNTAIRYSGSPVAISFNEEYEHSVTLAEVTHGEPPRLKMIPIEQLRPVHTIPSAPVNYEEALRLVADYPANDPSYLCLYVLNEGGLPIDSSDRVLEMTKGKECRFCKFKLADTDRDRMQGVSDALTVDEFTMMSPLDVARLYLDSKGIAADEWMEMMQETIRLMDEEKSR